MRRQLGPVIAERRLVSRGNARVRVRVSLGQPRPSKGDWECPFDIRGQGVSILEFGYGVDSMQALTTAVEGIRVLLNENFGSLVWEDGGVLVDHSGFQRQIPLLSGAFTRRLDRLVDRELNRHLRQLERRTATRRGAVGKKAMEGRENRSK